MSSKKIWTTRYLKKVCFTKFPLARVVSTCYSDFQLDLTSAQSNIMEITQYTDLICRGKGRICFVAVFGFFSAVYPKAVSKMFFLLGIGFFVLALLLAFAGEIIGLIVRCVELVWQRFRGLLAWLLVGWRGGMGGR